mmetsp:Transcript_7017/g.19055  ORF Transcript_7017/g.19055 Transcript_7017/m.19055 type:complete len:94 (-) Transcript_7017:180-461(-)
MFSHAPYSYGYDERANAACSHRILEGKAAAQATNAKKSLWKERKGKHGRQVADHLPPLAPPNWLPNEYTLVFITTLHPSMSFRTRTKNNNQLQ